MTVYVNHQLIDLPDDINSQWQKYLSTVEYIYLLASHTG